MVVRRNDETTVLIGTNDKYLLEELKEVCGGFKVRMKMQIVIPITSITKITTRIDMDEISWEDDTLQLYKNIHNNTISRESNIAKIKQQYIDGDVRFDYDYRGPFTIMKHQKVMFNLIKYNDCAALLADPGLGKTLCSLFGIDDKIKEGKVERCLYITLSSLKENVQAEIDNLIPHRSSVVLKGSAHADKVINKLYKQEKRNLDYDIYISNYESIHGMKDLFLSSYFDMVILDEVHRIGSPSSNQTKAIIKKFEPVKYKYIMTGTLNANNLMSFYMPYKFMNNSTIPYASYYYFRRQYMFTVDPDERIWKPNPGAVNEVAKIIAKTSATFKVEDCLDMPDVKYITVYNSMTGEQSKAYETAKKDMIADIEAICQGCEEFEGCALYSARKMGLKTDGLPCINEAAFISTALVLNLKLHQIASGFFINSWIHVNDEGKESKMQEIHDLGGSHKFKQILETIDSLPDDEQVLIFGTYTHPIKVLSELLSKKYGDRNVVTCYGSQDAFQAVEKHKKTGAKILIGNITKLGTGLNIQYTFNQMYIQNSFSFVQRTQAVGRCWRKGQTKRVRVWDFVTLESIDEKVIETLKNKKDLSVSLEQFSRVYQ